MYFIHSNYDLPVSKIIKIGSKLDKYLTESKILTRLYTYVHIYRKDDDAYVYLNTEKIFN